MQSILNFGVCVYRCWFFCSQMFIFTLILNSQTFCAHHFFLHPSPPPYQTCHQPPCRPMQNRLIHAFQKLQHLKIWKTEKGLFPQKCRQQQARKVLYSFLLVELKLICSKGGTRRTLPGYMVTKLNIGIIKAKDQVIFLPCGIIVITHMFKKNIIPCHFSY